MEISGKRALVLGANRGIGRAVALDLARRGARVIAGCYDWPDDTVSLERELAILDGAHQVIVADLRDVAGVRGFFGQLTTDYLDILINNLERGGMPVVHGPYSEEQWDLEIDTTMKAKWWVMREALPLLKGGGGGAAVVVISSISALVGRSGPAGLIFNDAYAAANRALASFTETWAREGAPGVRVNELMLGLIKTRHAEETRGWGLLTEEQRRALLGHTLLERSGEIAEVVQAVNFLISQATYMTGSVIRLDGGYLLGGERPTAMPPGILQPNSRTQES
ncbi:MAG TPA: SDR family oxidoreductase [Desulfurivibrio alkaliphilus]|uniref:SDR family oxidoreductase n=1 Tax=Desulfurivibrio alkaliphilus TaxID=427923 RepID=A0A7C2TKI9_9BACT|nr:SDR family oxidoreductase [Desulfurivibrio alkaliphilus]